MISNRRKFIVGLGSAIAVSTSLPAPALAAQTTRRFAAMLGRKQVGETTVLLSRSGGNVIAEIEARLHIGILGIINFDYLLQSRETWRDGILQELRSTTDNDGNAEYVNATRIDNGMQIDGSSFEGVISGNPATTSYFTSDFMRRPVWISTQTGRPMDLNIQNMGAALFDTAEGSLNCTKFTTRGKLKISLYYDQANEWVGSSFNVAGRLANISMSSRGQSFNDIWAG